MSPIERVARRFLPHFESLQPIASGFSGGRVYRLHSADGDFALKQYPAGYGLPRLCEIHAMQAHASSHLSMVPTLSP